MVTRNTPWPDGTPCWADMMVPDPRMAMDFYGALFGWDFTDIGDAAGNYLMCSVDGREVAGIGGTQPGQEDAPAAWTMYLATSDVDKTVAAIAGAGGQVMVPPTDVLDAGRMAAATDPTGAPFGLWQAGRTIGAQLANVPRTMVWNECVTDDFPRAKAFYVDVFGYGIHDMSSADYSYVALKVEGNIVGGLGAMEPGAPAGVPPRWRVYFGAADTDATVSRAQEIGGVLMAGPQDSPYGRVATVRDNQGAFFRVLSVHEEVAAAG